MLWCSIFYVFIGCKGTAMTTDARPVVTVGSSCHVMARGATVSPREGGPCCHSLSVARVARGRSVLPIVRRRAAAGLPPVLSWVSAAAHAPSVVVVVRIRATTSDVSVFIPRDARAGTE